jgi:hypothetical protein
MQNYECGMLNGYSAFFFLFCGAKYLMSVCHSSSSHVMPLWAGVVAGIYECILLYHTILQHYTRQQTTTNDYCRQQTFVQRIGLDKVCIFAAKHKDTALWKQSKPTTKK